MKIESGPSYSQDPSFLYSFLAPEGSGNQTSLCFMSDYSLVPRVSPSFPVTCSTVKWTASDRKLGEGLGTRLVRLHNAAIEQWAVASTVQGVLSTL